MKKNREYQQALDNYKDLQARGDEAIGGDALDFMNSMLTPEEIAESDLRVALMGELIKARQEKGISQRELEKLSGVSQPVIARMEKGYTSPQLDTIVKLLRPLGKKLAIVPIDEK